MRFSVRVIPKKVFISPLREFDMLSRLKRGMEKDSLEWISNRCGERGEGIRLSPFETLLIEVCIREKKTMRGLGVKR